ACLSVMGAVAGPLVGLFFLGIFFPKANKNGAILGLVLSEMFLIWICIGANIYTPYKDYVLPTNLTCTTQSSSGFANHSSLTQPLAERIDLHYGDQSVFYLYRISPFLYSIIGIILTAIVGVPTSLLFPTEPQTAYQRRTQHALTYFGRHEPLESGDSVKEKERLLYHRGRLSPNVQI
uniref:Uncharacterized protein n=1 Tax=Plectus sambesii TaxID=2011161 RepID=A0A914VKJ6_9BILA